jgi:hypothetical protein
MKPIILYIMFYFLVSYFFNIDGLIKKEGY